MYYQLNRIKARTRTTTPTLTDQSQLKNTDINLMLGNFEFGDVKTGVGAAAAPTYEDYSEVPTDFRDIIELQRQLPNTRQKLPPALQGIPIDQLLNLTQQQLLEILTPPAPEPAKPTEEPK